MGATCLDISRQPPQPDSQTVGGSGELDTCAEAIDLLLGHLKASEYIQEHVMYSSE